MLSNFRIRYMLTNIKIKISVVFFLSGIYLSPLHLRFRLQTLKYGKYENIKVNLTLSRERFPNVKHKFWCNSKPFSIFNMFVCIHHGLRAISVLRASSVLIRKKSEWKKYVWVSAICLCYFRCKVEWSYALFLKII